MASWKFIHFVGGFPSGPPCLMLEGISLNHIKYPIFVVAIYICINIISTCFNLLYSTTIIYNLYINIMSPFFNLYLTIIQPTNPLSLRIFTRSLPEQAQSVHAAAESQSLGDQVQGRLAMAGPATDGGMASRWHQQQMYQIEDCLPSGYVKIAMENHHVQWEIPLYMVIFNSYVKLPEGNMWNNHLEKWSSLMGRMTSQLTIKNVWNHQPEETYVDIKILS